MANLHRKGTAAQHAAGSTQYPHCGLILSIWKPYKVRTVAASKLAPTMQPLGIQMAITTGLRRLPISPPPATEFQDAVTAQSPEIRQGARSPTWPGLGSGSWCGSLTPAAAGAALQPSPPRTIQELPLSNPYGSASMGLPARTHPTSGSSAVDGRVLPDDLDAVDLKQRH